MADYSTFQDKLTMVYGELDTRKTRSVSLDAFTQVLSKFQIGLSGATTQDLFFKADANGDGVLSLSEFQRFAEGYPTLLDVIYYRAKDYYANEKMLEELEIAGQKASELRSREAALLRASEQAANEVGAQEHALQLADSTIQDCENREQLAKSNLDREQSVSETCRQDLTQRGVDLANSRENLRGCQSQLNEAARDTEQQTQRLQQAENAAANAEQKLREIERLLQEQQQAVEEARANTLRNHDELQQCRVREEATKATVQDAERGLDAAGEAAVNSEKTLGDQLEREKEASNILREVTAQTAKAVSDRDHEHRTLQACKDKHAASMIDHENGVRNVENQERQIENLKIENDAQAQRRQRVMEEENPLVEQEIRLKEQRDCLESKELELRTRFTSYSNARQSPVPTNRRSASPELPTSGSPYHRRMISSSPSVSPSYVR
eukprot:TRINITY_DN8950_c1_g5_i1.p1 TRINITY_DN8950_c1_g5~~TRINITY_DN8950_c1_g5_i1.p1  ORF type:complete len:439 (+),score=101.41 TRINITY_DN8950_c1_g5_i1:58-1374(+)